MPRRLHVATDITGGKPTSSLWSAVEVGCDYNPSVAQLVQRYLDRIRAEHADVPTVPWPATSPNSRASTPTGSACRCRRRTATSTNPAMPESNSPSNRSRSRSPTRWRWIGSARTRWTPRSASSPRVRRSTRSASTRPPRQPKNPMINAGAIAAVSLDPREHARRAFRADPGLLLRVRRPAAGTRRRRVRVGEGHRQPQPRHRLHAAELRRPRRRPRRRARRVLPAVLVQRDGDRPGADGGHAGARRHQPDDGPPGDRRRGGAGARCR